MWAFQNVKKNYGEKLDFVKIAFISFRARMLKSKNLTIDTSSKAQFTVTFRTSSVYIAKANVLKGIVFILLYKGFETSLIWQKLIFFLSWIELTLRTKISESAHQLRLKAVEMLRSSTQLVKSRGDDLGLEYLWNRDEYGSLENHLKAMEKNAEYGGQPEILAPLHVIERPITVHYYKTQTKALYLLIALA